MGNYWFTNIHPNIEGSSVIADEIIKYFRTHLGFSSGSEISIDAKIFLEGNYINGLMRTDLNSFGYLPLLQPFNLTPWNYNGNESVQSFPNDIVDWILIELRSSMNSSSIVTRRAGLLKSNGHIVDLDGNSSLKFNAESGSYYVVIHHRNHLSIMSANPVALSTTQTSYNFTTGQNKAYGNTSLINLGDNNFGLISGDADGNGIINILDYSPIEANLFNSGFRNEDLDLNSVVNILDYGKTNKNLLRISQVPY
jgi:hypothetical protein